MVRSRRVRRDPGSGVPDADASGPVRMCIGCRRRGATDTLVRLVASDGPPGYLVGRALPGRGAWLCRADGTPLPLETCLGEAIRRKAFVRAFRVASTGRN